MDRAYTVRVEALAPPAQDVDWGLHGTPERAVPLPRGEWRYAPFHTHYGRAGRHESWWRIHLDAAGDNVVRLELSDGTDDPHAVGIALFRQDAPGEPVAETQVLDEPYLDLTGIRWVKDEFWPGFPHPRRVYAENLPAGDYLVRVRWSFGGNEVAAGSEAALERWLRPYGVRWL